MDVLSKRSLQRWMLSKTFRALKNLLFETSDSFQTILLTNNKEINKNRLTDKLGYVWHKKSNESIDYIIRSDSTILTQRIIKIIVIFITLFAIQVYKWYKTYTISRQICIILTGRSKRNALKTNVEDIKEFIKMWCIWIQGPRGNLADNDSISLVMA